MKCGNQCKNETGVTAQALELLYILACGWQPNRPGLNLGETIKPIGQVGTIILAIYGVVHSDAALRYSEKKHAKKGSLNEKDGQKHLNFKSPSSILHFN